MIYIGMDVHQKSTTICIQNEEGRQMLLDTCPTTYKGFLTLLGPWFAKYPGTPVGMESCSKAYITSGIIAALGGEPHVYPADEVAKKTRSRKKKTDARDAQDLCTNMRCGALIREVAMPPESMRRLRSVLQARQLQVKIQVQAVNAAKALLREYGLAGATGSISTEKAWLERLNQTMPDMIRALLEAHLGTFLLAQQQANALQAQARQLGKANPQFEQLETIPGVGPITRLAAAAYLFSMDRFSNAKQVVAYTGLCPSSYDSGSRERKGRITKEGPSLLRALLVEAAQHARRPTNPLNPFYRRWVVKHGHKKATVAVAAKLCRIMYSMMKQGSPMCTASLGVRWDEERGCYVRLKPRTGSGSSARRPGESATGDARVKDMPDGLAAPIPDPVA